MIGTKGELTFLFNALQMKYCEQHTVEGAQKLDYQTISDVIAAANDANAEFYRRIMIPYETHKIQENGDIFREFIRKVNI